MSPPPSPAANAIYEYVRAGRHAVQMNGNATNGVDDNDGRRVDCQRPDRRRVTTGHEPDSCGDADDAAKGPERRLESADVVGTPSVAV
jgi:hypothetical protein